MKKHYLFSCVLLLSIPYVQYSCAMQEQHYQFVNQPARAQQCALCGNDTTYGNTAELRVRLGCGHIFHRGCLAPWILVNRCPIEHCHGSLIAVLDAPDVFEQPMQQAQEVQQVADERTQLTQVEREMINQIAHDLSNVLQVTQQQAQQEPELAQRAEPRRQRRGFTQAQQILISQVARFVSNLPEFAQQQAAQRAQPVVPMQAINGAQSTVPVQVELPPLDEQEQALVAQLAQELERLERDDIDEILFQAYTNPYVLIQNSVFIAALNNDQKALVDLLLSRYIQRITQQN